MTVIASGLNTEFSGTFAVSQGRAYFANDFDPVKSWNGVSAAMYDAGITAPASAPTAPVVGSGVVTAGKHLVRYRYLDSSSLYVSNPSVSSALLADGVSKYTFTVGTQFATSADAKCDQIIVEMTPVNSGSYYRVGTVLNIAAQTIDINLTDAVLIVQESVSAVTGDYGHEKPPLSRCIAEHRGRIFLGGSTTRTRSVGVTNASATVSGTNFSTLWVGRRIKIGTDAVTYQIAQATSTSITLDKVYAGTTGTYDALIYSGTPNRIYWTRALYPEGYKPATDARDFLQNRSDTLSGITSYSGDLWVFGKHSAERLVYTDDPSVFEGQIIPMPGDRGCHNQQCIIQVEGALFVWDRAGIYSIAGGAPKHLSKPVDEILQGDVDWDYNDKFHGVFDPIDRVIMFFYVEDGQTEPMKAVCLDLDEGRWFFSKWRQPITASCVAPDDSGQVRALLGDYNGYTWFHGYDDVSEGVPSGWPQEVTAAAGSSATVINVSESLPTTTNANGSTLLNPLTGLYGTIASSTTSSITLTAPGITNAPAAGTKLYLGSVPWEYETKWNVISGIHLDKRPRYLLVSFVPGNYKIKVYYYIDFATNPIAPTKFPSDQFSKGASVKTGYIEIDASVADAGTCGVPMPADWARSIKAKLVIDTPTGSPRILGIDWWPEESDGPDA
jgi:hypothetical protein